MLARISDDKGHDVLIKSISLLNKNLLKKIKVILIGRGNKNEILQIKILIKKYNLENYYHYLKLFIRFSKNIEPSSPDRVSYKRI